MTTQDNPAKGEETLFSDDSGFVVQLLWTSTEETAELTPQGGGFVLKMPREEFNRRFKPAKPPEFALTPISADWLDENVRLQAYTNGYRWNGWAQPYFTLEQAKVLQEHMPALQYSSEEDVFLMPDDNEDEPWRFAPETIQVSGEAIKVYGIGAGAWCWTADD